MASSEKQVISLVNEHDSIVEYYPNFFSLDQAESLFQLLKSGVPWRRRQDLVGVQKRLSYYMGDPGTVFEYVGLREEPAPWIPEVEQVRHVLAQFFQVPLAACLLNNYEASQGTIDWHYDEIRAHGPHKAVASLTLGAARPIEFQHQRDSDKRQFRQLLGVGSVLFMRGETQANWRHRLVLEPEFQGHRISLTYRSIVPGFEDQLAHSQSKPKIDLCK